MRAARGGEDVEALERAHAVHLDVEDAPAGRAEVDLGEVQAQEAPRAGREAAELVAELAPALGAVDLARRGPRRR